MSGSLRWHRATELREVMLEAPDPDRFRAALGTFATGVTVVTAMADGHPHGMTANAFTSVSLRPPLVLVCLRRGSRLGGILVRAGAFAVNVLQEDQAHLARYFADPSRPHGARAFRGVPYLPSPLGSPLVPGALAHIDCSVDRMLDGGDHVICLGEVRGVAVHPGAPLTFYRGRFWKLGAVEADDRELLEWPWV